MIKKLFFTSTFLFAFLSLPVHAASQSQYKVEFNKDDFKTTTLSVEVDGKNMSKSTLIKQYQKQIGIANKELKEKAKQKNRGNPLQITTINVVKDCTASVSCGGGQTISCSISGPGTCESGMHSVACITANKADAKVCDPPGGINP